MSEKIINDIADKIGKFLPPGTNEYIANLIFKHEVFFTVSKPRKTKLGDYRFPTTSDNRHQISINGNLNQYAFLVTTVHELAHLTTFVNYGRYVQPHGEEWKSEFRKLFKPIQENEILPDDIQMAVRNYLKNAKASSHSDSNLLRVLKRYDKKKDVLHVESLKIGAVFKLNDRIFVKGKKLRKYHLCKELSTGKEYRVFGLAEIIELENE